MPINNNPSLIARGFLGIFIVLLLAACSGQAGQPTQPITNPAANPTTSGSAPTDQPPAVQAATPAQPEAAAPQDASFPTILSDKTLAAFEIASFKGPSLPFKYQMAEDGQGALHVVWGSLDQLFHRQWDTNGQWSAVTTFPTAKNTRAESARLLITPAGQACVLWPNDQIRERFEIECQSGGQWNPSPDLIQLNPIDFQIGIESYQAQFDPAGHLQIFLLLRSGNKDTSGYALGKQLLFPNEDTSMDVMYQFRIDPQGNYHLVFSHGQSLIYRVSKDQGKTWQEPGVQAGAAINDGYARVAPNQDSYFHFMLFGGNGVSLVSWISTQPTPEGLPLFNSDEIFKKAMKDQRYLPLSLIRPQAVAVDSQGRLHFAATYADGSYYLVLETNGSWKVQNIRGMSFEPQILVSQKGEVVLLWRTMDGLFFANLAQ